MAEQKNLIEQLLDTFLDIKNIHEYNRIMGNSIHGVIGLTSEQVSKIVTCFIESEGDINKFRELMTIHALDSQEYMFGMLKSFMQISIEEGRL